MKKFLRKIVFAFALLAVVANPAYAATVDDSYDSGATVGDTYNSGTSNATVGDSYNSGATIGDEYNSGSISTSAPTASSISGKANKQTDGKYTVQLYAYVNSGNLTTTHYFKYGINTSSLTGESGRGSRSSSGNVSTAIYGVNPGSTVYYSFTVSNTSGSHTYGTYSVTTPSDSNDNGGGNDSSSKPTVTTGTYSVSNYTATIYGTVTSNGASTSYTLRYRPQGGSWANVGSGTLSSSATSKQVNSNSFGVSANNTYEYQLIASNSKGQTDGSILSFYVSSNGNSSGGGSGSGWGNQSYGVSTPFTYEAGPVNGTTATLNGMVQSDGLTEVWFEYGTVNGNFNNSYGYRLVGNGKYDITSNVPYLLSETTYYFRLVSRNGANLYRGEARTFTTGREYPAVNGYGRPLAETLSARYIGQNGAVLVSRVNANGGSNTYWFEYGTSTVPTLWSGRTMAMSVSTNTFWYERVFGLTGLAPQTTYYYRVVAQNPNGTTYGDIKSFTTLAYGTVIAGSTGSSTVKKTPSTIKKYSGSNSSSDTDSIVSDDEKTASVILDSYVSSEEVNAGDEIKLSLTYRNTGGGKANDAVLKVALPPEIEFVASSVTPTSKMGSDLKFTLGNIAGNSQSDITVTVKVKKIVEAGSTIAFNSFLEYYDESNKLQTVNAFNSVSVKESKSSFTGSLADFAGASGNVFTIILFLMVLAAFIYMIATRRR